jgi:hypothetical protein
LFFRADVLPPIMFRMGILAALRSKKCHGEYIGMMITASHNPGEVRLDDMRETSASLKL